MDELIAEIVEDLKIELESDVGFSEDALTAKTRNAYREVKLARHYPSTYTDDMVNADMEQFISVIRDIAPEARSEFSPSYQSLRQTILLTTPV